jgi:predicted transcriptional regulator
MSTRTNPQTSLDAYKSLNQENVRDVYVKILNALKVLGSANTEKISEFLTMEHPKVHKRVSEMARLEMIYKPGTKSIMKSGRSGYNWAIRGTGQKEQAVEVTYKPQEKTVSDYANKIIEQSQLNLFN